jgi:hypothetical protein
MLAQLPRRSSSRIRTQPEVEEAEPEEEAVASIRIEGHNRCSLYRTRS